MNTLVCIYTGTVKATIFKTDLPIFHNSICTEFRQCTEKLGITDSPERFFFCSLTLLCKKIFPARTMQELNYLSIIPYVCIFHVEYKDKTVTLEK